MFGSLMGDFEDDPIFGHHMRSMRQMNSMMNSMFADPFGAFDAMNGLSALTGGFGPQQSRQNAMGFGNSLMPFGFPSMPNMNRLLTGDNDGTSFSSSSVITMTQGADGRPQVYQATSSTKTGPGGIRETQKTVQDTRSGVKKMAIGHHIGDRAHIIEREQNMRSGQQEERQDFINLDEDDAEDFDREFKQKSQQTMRHNEITEVSGNSRRQPQAIMPAPNSSSSTSEEAQPEITMPLSPSQSPTNSQRSRNDKCRAFKNRQMANLATPRRPLRTPMSSPLTMCSGLESFMSPRKSIHHHPYNNVSPSPRRNHHRAMKSNSSNANTQHHVQIEELPDDYDENTSNSNEH